MISVTVPEILNYYLMGWIANVVTEVTNEFLGII